MLLLGTTDHLEDLDRQFTLAQDVSVGAIAVGAEGGSAGVFALVDGDRIVKLESYEVVPVASVGPSSAQSLGAVDGGLLVGLDGARLAELSLTVGTLSPVASFDHVPGRATWENPAGETPDPPKPLRTSVISAVKNTTYITRQRDAMR